MKKSLYTMLFFIGVCILSQSLQASSKIVSNKKDNNQRACLHDFGNFNNENVIVNLSCNEIGHQRQKWSY